MAGKLPIISDEILLDLEDPPCWERLKPIRPLVTCPAPAGADSLPGAGGNYIAFVGLEMMFLVFGGVMSGLLVVITVARAFFYLVGRKHI